MALRLKVGVIQAGVSYVTSEAEASQARDAGAVRRAALNPEPPLDRPYVSSRNMVAVYLDGGVIRIEQARAAEEIALHWHCVTRGLHAKCALYGERMPSGAASDHPAEVARTARYRAWANWADGQAVTRSVSLTTLTLDLAVDGLSWVGLRTRRRISNERAKRLVQCSLWQYALLSGWVVERIAKAA